MAVRLTERAGLPRFPLAVLPTPLVRARRLEAALGSPPIHVKRDDLTGFAAAGNKARKLELLVAEAIRRGCDVVVTGGSPQSNHCRATAAAARVAGLGCELILSGNGPQEQGPNLAWMRFFGATVQFTGDPDRGSVDAAIEARAREPANPAPAYAIPRGGASPLGAAAYADAVSELACQLEEAGIVAEVVVVATGSCATQAGLLAGAAALGLPWRIVGAAVSRAPEECRRRVRSLAADCAGLLGTAPPEPEAVEVVDARGPGHDVPSEAGTQAARLAAAREGLLLDATFTAKAFAVLLDLVRGGLDGPAVFLHTGGVPVPIPEGDDARA